MKILVYESVDAPFNSAPKEPPAEWTPKLLEAAADALMVARENSADGYVIAVKFNGHWITDKEQ